MSWTSPIPHQCRSCVILCLLLHNTCHIFKAEWIFKLSVNTACNWYRSYFSSHWASRTWVENTPTILTGNNWASHSVVCQESPDSDALFHPDSSPLYCLTAVMCYFSTQRQICGTRGWADVCWVDKTTVLTISAYLLTLTWWEQGHGWMHLPYRHIYVGGGQPKTAGQAFFFAPPCLRVSGGLFVPCTGRMQAVG